MIIFQFFIKFKNYLSRKIDGDKMVVAEVITNPGVIFSMFFGLLIFGNIENLVLSSQGVVAGVNPRKLGLFSIIVVIFWLFIGTVLTDMALQYSNYIEFIGGLAIFILGIQSMVGAISDYRKGDSK